MPKDTKTLGNNKARACESLGFVHKKRLCQRFDTTSFQVLLILISNSIKVIFMYLFFLLHSSYLCLFFSQRYNIKSHLSSTSPEKRIFLLYTLLLVA